MSSSSSLSSARTTNVFELGNYGTELLSVEPNYSLSVPLTKPLLIATPSQEGEYPVQLFLHGYLFLNTFYSQLINHIASHGFIVIAPQLYDIEGFDANEEIKSAKAVTDWLPIGLSSILPQLVKPNLTKSALSGQSKGGKSAFALALESNTITNTTNSTMKYSVLMGIDPVDGASSFNLDIQSNPKVLTYVPHSFDLNHLPVLVVGSGYGELKNNIVSPPCCPEGLNHKDFYNECQAPAYHFVVKDYGHNDFLDDETKGIRGDVTYFICKNGKERKPMRSFAGGIMVAFMKAYLENDHEYLKQIMDGKDRNIPVELETAESFID